jgi:hypothetical protein
VKREPILSSLLLSNDFVRSFIDDDAITLCNNEEDEETEEDETQQGQEKPTKKHIRGRNKLT